MAPKKSKKISLNEFLVDSSLGNWADEMDALLPNAPAGRADEEQGQRFGRRDDYSSSRQERHPSIREDVELPSQPPYTAFVGNLAFDTTEVDLSDFFSSSKIKSVKIIKDKEERPKGFGYVEFDDLEGLKDGLTKTGSNFAGRTIRVNVAEPPKERIAHSNAPFDDSKFDNPWRRDGPLPTRDSSHRRYDGPPGERQGSRQEGPRQADDASQWRSNRSSRQLDLDAPSFKRKNSGVNSDGNPGAADKEETWSIGSKFRPSTDAPHEESQGRFGSTRGKGDMGPPKEIPSDEGDWRRKPPRGNMTPTDSTPPTPQLGRKKLELLPRSGNVSVTPSPLASPKTEAMSTSSNSKLNPFGSAKPVDASSREKEVAERLQRDKGGAGDKLAISRTSSRTGVDRAKTRTPPSTSSTQSKSSFPRSTNTVRPNLSFAIVAKGDQINTENEVSQISQDTAE